MISLGYSEKDALRMVSKIDSKDSSEIIKLALKSIRFKAVDKKDLKAIHKLLFVKKFKDYIYKSKFISTHQESIDINLKNWVN